MTVTLPVNEFGVAPDNRARKKFFTHHTIYGSRGDQDVVPDPACDRALRTVVLLGHGHGGRRVSHPIALVVGSPFEVEVSRLVGALIWKEFLTGKPSFHSGQAVTLPYLMRRAQRNRVPFRVEFHCDQDSHSAWTIQRISDKGDVR
jgi:hypothetical protein